MNDAPPYLLIDYTPIAAPGQPPTVAASLNGYPSQFRIDFDALPPSLQTKLNRLTEYCVAAVEVPELDLGGAKVRGVLTPIYYQVTTYQTPWYLELCYEVSGGMTSSALPISDATRRLIENIWPTCEQLAWTQLRQRFSVPQSDSTAGVKRQGKLTPLRH